MHFWNLLTLYPGGGALDYLFCPEGRFLYAMFVPKGRFLAYSSHVLGVCSGEEIVLDEIDSRIRVGTFTK